MKKRIIKKVGHELEIQEDGKRYCVGLGSVVEINKKGEVIDLIDFVSPSLIKGPPPIMEKYKYLKDGESVEEITDEDVKKRKKRKAKKVKCQCSSKKKQKAPKG